MKLFNKTIDKQLFKQYALGSDLSKQEVVAKIFNPQGAQSWFILNSDPEDPDYLWAIVDLGYGAEIGSVSRNELESYRGRFGLGFERDLSFDPINAEELYEGLRRGNNYAKGGNLSRDRKFVNHSENYEVEYSKGKNRAGYGNQSFADGGEVSFIDYKDCEIMYEPHYNKYYANDVEFDSLKEAQEFIDSGEIDPSIRDAYSKGMFADGGSVNVGYNVFNYTDNIYATDEVFKTKALANKFIKEFRSRFSNQGYYRDNRMNKINIQDIDLLAIPSDFNPFKKYADGGQIEVVYERRADFKKKPVKLLLLSRGKEQKGFTFSGKDQVAVLDNYNRNKQEDLERLWDLKGYETKYADGGDIEKIKEGDKVVYKDNVYLVSKIEKRNIQGLHDVQYHLISYKKNLQNVVVDNVRFIKKFADGGNIADFSDNQRMIMNQNVELEHHHEELEDILEDEIPVPAWVVAKMATATNSVSDVTHYLDGQKELMEDEDEDENEDQEAIENKEVVEPINVSAGTKAELTKKFTDDAWGNLRGFLKGMEGIDLRDDYTFDYKNEQFEVEPIINSDENSVSNAVFTIFDGDGEEVGEFTYSRDGGKQKFTANSEFFSWNNAKFEDGGFMNGVYADGGYFDGTIPKVSSYMSNYAKGGEIAKAEILGFSRNVMGTTDIEMKITGMRKPQDFIVYPIGKDDAGNVITIQSDTRIGQINLVKGVGVMSQSHSSGAYFVHLQMDKLTSFTISESDLEDIKAHVFKTAGANVGTRGIVTDNSGASGVYAKGGVVVTKIEDIPNLTEKVNKGKVTYRGLGMGKLANDFYNLAGTSGTRIKVDGKEYYITDKEFDTFSRGADGKMRVSFDAPARRHEDGGFMNNVYAKGGITYYKNENERLSRPKSDMEEKVFEKVKNQINSELFIGNFGWKTPNDKTAYGYLYSLDDFDKNLIKNLKLKQGEEVFRYVTRVTAISGMMPFIKINIEKALLYFPMLNDSDDIVFETRGVTPLWISLIEGSFADGGNLKKNLYPKEVKVEKKDVSKFKEILNEIGIKSPYSEDISDKQFNIEQIAFYFKNEDDRQKAFNKYHQILADGGFMNNVYAKGGSVKKDWWHTVVNPNEDFNNFDDKMPIDWEVDDFKSWVVSESDLDGNVDKEVLEVVKIPKSKLTVEYLNKNGSGKNNNEFYKEFGNWQSALYDIFTQMKKDYLFKKSLKYVLKADIKTVTVKTKNGKEVTYNGADVLNGNYVLAKGGDITSKATYFGKNNVVGVELKDGTTIKPANGYWVKKGAEPIGAEPTPTSSGKSEPKMNTTQIRKDARGNWRAETNVENFNGYDWRISTLKTYTGNLVSSAQGGKTESTGTKGIVMFKYAPYEDPNHTLEVSKPKRLTDKVVSEQHDKALAKFKKFMETGMFKGGGKISNFDKLSDKVAKEYEGKPVKSQYQEEYGKYYSKEEAQEVGDKVAGKVKAMQTDSKAFGGLFSSAKSMVTPKKYPELEGKQVALKTGKFVQVFTQAGSTLSVLELGKVGSGERPYSIDISEVDLTSYEAGGQTSNKKVNSSVETLKKANILAKEIRKDGESWLDAKKRAFAQLKK